MLNKEFIELFSLEKEPSSPETLQKARFFKEEERKRRFILVTKV
jgi:N-acyl-L-homoserine lactone synthetase